MSTEHVGLGVLFDGGAVAVDTGMEVEVAVAGDTVGTGGIEVAVAGGGIVGTIGTGV